jgi:hypothetical protein
MPVPLATNRVPAWVDQALQLADHAAALTNRRKAGGLDVLAAAQAAAGHFDRAVASCDESPH